MELTPKNVQDIVLACLYTEEEIKDKTQEELIAAGIKTEGIMTTFVFVPARLEKYKEDIKSMLSELPSEFMADVGGGWSFLQACQTKDGKQWGEHQNMDELFCLGMAMGFVKLCTPREVWSALPGGMPYYAVDLETPKEKPAEETSEQGAA